MKYNWVLATFLFSLFFGSYHLFGQEISGPENILNQLESELADADFEQSDKLRLYGATIKRLTNRGNYDQADSVYKSIPLHLLQQKEDSLYIAEIDRTRAFMNRVKGRYSLALEIYLDLLTYYVSIEDVDNIALSYAYLGEFHRARRRYEPAERYLSEAKLIIDQDKVSKSTVAYWYSRKAAIQNERDSDADSTLYYAFMGLQLATDKEAYYTKALLLNEIGFASAMKGSISGKKIIDYYNRSITIMLENEHYLDFLFINNNLAYYYMGINEYEKALPILRKPLKMAEKNGWNMGLESNYRRLSQTLAALGQMEESYEFRKKSYEVQLINLADKSSIAVEELSATYEKSVAEENLKKQQLATTNAKKEANNNRRALIATITFTIILLLITFVSVSLFFRFRKKNALLRSQQDIIQKTNAQLTNAVNQKNVLYRELNHRVKNNLTILSGLIYLQESIEKDPGHQKLYQTLRHRIQSMAIVHQHLYAFNEAQNINFHEYLRQLLPEIAAAYNGDKDVNTSISCNNLVVTIDEAVPMAMIINELITNSFKHAFQSSTKGEIKIWSGMEDEKRTIHYKDNGVGMPQNIEGEGLQSLGMHLINLMVQQLKGKLFYEGGSDGVYYRIELPQPG